MADHTTLHINCTPEQKQAWMLSARISGRSFEDWVRLALDAANVDYAPAGLDGLSERARICLLSAGISNRQQLADAMTDGLDIITLPNAGRVVSNEVNQWIK